MTSHRDTTRWRVKITGLSPDVTTFDLSNQFDTKPQFINIPKSQPNSSTWYALIDGFKSEEETLMFASKWNKAFIHRRIGIRCETDAVADTSMNHESNAAIESNSDDLYSSPERTHSKRTPCRHGDSCFSADCPYKHSSEWRACKNGAQCNDFTCSANHPRIRKDKCRYGSTCRTPSCSYLHPNMNKSKHSYDVDQKPCNNTNKGYSQKHHRFKPVETRMAERQIAQLPIFALHQRFCDRLQQEKILFVMAETSSGKSTQLPQYAAECFPDDLVVCTQPRAITAMTLARRVANEYDGTAEGNSVGYQIGNSNDQDNDDCVIGTSIMFMTDAALIHEFQLDSNLSRIRVLIIDEVHDRSLNTDIVMGIAKLLLAKRTDDFFVVIASATIDPEPFLNFFNRPSRSPLCVKDQIHSVTIENLPPSIDCPDYKFIELHVIPTLLRLYPKHTGHTLVFLPSQRDIEKALQMFSSNIPDGCVALPLYGSLSFEEQNKILNFDDKKRSNERMVVFCTNVAETSLTIKNVQLVIDTGLVRQLRFDKQYHWNVSETVRISRFSANKRKDIAGCTRRGCCVRLYNDDELKEENIEPEILRSPLDLVLLQLKCLHLDPETFPFMTKPDSISVRSSLDLLTKLICLDKRNKITSRGELFAELSINPRLSAFMVNVYTEQKEGQRLLPLVATIVAILLAPGPFFLTNRDSNNINGSFRHSTISDADKYNSDLFYLCTVFNEWKVVGTIDRKTNKCVTCHKSPQQQSTDICQSCRTQHSFMNELNHQVLQLIDSSIEFYIKTITNSRWKLTPNVHITNKESNDGDIIGEHLRKLFPAQLGHLLVPYLPDEGVRLIESDLRANIANRSIYVQRAHDHTHQYFIAMSITRLPSGRYIVDRLHQVSSQHLPTSPIQQILVRENVGWSISNEVRTLFNGIRSETWAKWLVHEYDRVSCRLTIWGLTTDQSHLEAILKPILANTHSKTIECGPIKATFQNGLICSAIEIMENALRLNLQRVPCKNYEKLQVWLKTKLNINRHDIRENNFQEHRSSSSDDDDDDDDDDDVDDYEAPPFYIILKSMDAFQRATANLPPHHICSQETLSSSTTGTHMSEKDAWGRQLVLTIPQNSSFISDKEILNRLTPHAVDCRQFGKKNLRAQPSIQLTNLSRDTNESFMRQILQPINPLKISLRQTHKDGTGSSSAHIFFADNQQRQQAITILQSDFCQKPVQITVRHRTSHQLVQKQVVPTLTELQGTDPISKTFLITTINRESTIQLYKEIIPKIESSWKIDSSATVTITHPHLYPDLDTLIQQIANQFEIQVQQQSIDKKQQQGRGTIRCFFNNGAPQKTALAAAMLAQATSPIIIKMTNDRQKQLFDELFSHGIWIEIRGPQVQQGQLMRQIADYSDTFDERFRVLDLNSTIANFFGRKKLADSQLQSLADHWSNWGCNISYVSKTKSIIIYAQPSTKLSFIDSCEAEVKQILSKLSVDGNITRDKQKCVFCGKISYSTNILRACGHTYCRCAASYLIQTYPLQCNESKCKMNIDMQDLFEIFPEREEFIRVCKKSIQIYLKDKSNLYDQLFCPNQVCNGLIKRNRGYQICLTCGRNVCPSCSLIDDDTHQGRTCTEREMFHKMGDFLPQLFKEAEKFARDNWTPPTPPIIRIDYNMALADQCESLKRFYKGVETLGNSLPPDMARGFFAFHGTAATAIKPICNDGFDPKRRAGQAYGPGEYFGVSTAVSHGYCRPSNPQGPYAMIIAFLLNCPQLSTRPGFCHVMNNPIDWSYALNVPAIVVSYGTQTSCQSPLNN